MSEPKDYYRTLGLSPEADAEAIRRAYRRLARRHHPDRNPEAPEAAARFREVREAYEVLGRPERRRLYDRTRGGFGRLFDAYVQGEQTYHAEQAPAADAYEPAARAANPARPGKAPSGKTPPRKTAPGGAASGKGAGGFFSKIFGAGAAPGKAAPRRPRPPGPDDVQTTCALSFAQALAGGPTEVRLPTGEAVRIDIPRGVRHGFRIRLRGFGVRLAEGSPKRGDLIVRFEVAPDPRFAREGCDLHTPLRLNALQAMVGAVVSLPSPYGGQLKLALPPGTASGDRFRLRGQGVQTAGGAGDLYVRAEVFVPRDLTAAQQAVLREAAGRAGLL